MVESHMENGGPAVTFADSDSGAEASIKYSPKIVREMSVENLDLTPIQQFYHGQSVFVTGGTGFMGKLLIEKLLRTCPDLHCIYLLVRPKKGKDVDQRTDELFDDPVCMNKIFSLLKNKLLIPLVANYQFFSVHS